MVTQRTFALASFMVLDRKPRRRRPPVHGNQTPTFLLDIIVAEKMWLFAYDALWIRITCVLSATPSAEGRKIADWLQFSWKSMCGGTVTQGRHMTLVQRPW